MMMSNILIKRDTARERNRVGDEYKRKLKATNQTDQQAKVF